VGASKSSQGFGGGRGSLDGKEGSTSWTNNRREVCLTWYFAAWSLTGTRPPHPRKDNITYQQRFLLQIKLQHIFDYKNEQWSRRPIRTHKPKKNSAIIAKEPCQQASPLELPTAVNHHTGSPCAPMYMYK
jgi:hypothetical protein